MPDAGGLVGPGSGRQLELVAGVASAVSYAWYIFRQAALESDLRSGNWPGSRNRPRPRPRHQQQAEALPRRLADQRCQAGRARGRRRYRRRRRSAATQRCGTAATSAASEDGRTRWPRRTAGANAAQKPRRPTPQDAVTRRREVVWRERLGARAGHGPRGWAVDTMNGNGARRRLHSRPTPHKRAALRSERPCRRAAGAGLSPLSTPAASPPPSRRQRRQP